MSGENFCNELGDNYSMAPRIGSGSPAPVPRTTTGTTGSASRPATATTTPTQTGFSGSSSFENPGQLSGWKANDPYMKAAFEDLKKIDSPEARRAMEILSKPGTPTKEELDELGSAKDGTGLLGKLKDQLHDAAPDAEGNISKLADQATSMLGVVKGFISWMANNLFMGK